ncbi:hypothetical protein R3W88_030034 [Solanum pinnatisectum]|uniref:RNase H type-1 domain-containing protein n=1 Tax=Solanum pinnatisectum TaxID=50273 RepID=A0AAV9K6Z7_9SOLN|nr:hypothetical protein R3W88_030034 [Solanum pinnatisectum]
MWHIWINRNNNIYKNSKVDVNVMGIMNRATKYVFLGPSRNPKSIVTSNPNPCHWHPPTTGLKLNVDGSFDHNTFKGGTWCVIRDSKGNWIAGKTTISPLPLTQPR